MTLKEFRDLTAGRPEDSEIRIESYYAPGKSGTSPVFDVCMSATQIALLPEQTRIEDGEQVLHVAHTKKTGTTS